MSKRGADRQISNKDGPNDTEGYGGTMPNAQRATAAQMANRALQAKSRSIKRPTSARPLGSSVFSGLTAPQQSFPPFGQSSSASSNGFTFGQNSSTSGQSNSTFPAFSTNNTFTAPSTSSFNFNSNMDNNPFTSLTTQASPMPQNTGFQGSIFQFSNPAPQPAPASPQIRQPQPASFSFGAAPQSQDATMDQDGSRTPGAESNINQSNTEAQNNSWSTVSASNAPSSGSGIFGQTQMSNTGVFDANARQTTNQQPSATNLFGANLAQTTNKNQTSFFPSSASKTNVSNQGGINESIRSSAPQDNAQASPFSFAQTHSAFQPSQSGIFARVSENNTAQPADSHQPPSAPGDSMLMSPDGSPQRPAGRKNLYTFGSNLGSAPSTVSTKNDTSDETQANKEGLRSNSDPASLPSAPLTYPKLPEISSSDTLLSQDQKSQPQEHKAVGQVATNPFNLSPSPFVPKSTSQTQQGTSNQTSSMSTPFTFGTPSSNTLSNSIQQHESRDPATPLTSPAKSGTMTGGPFSMLKPNDGIFQAQQDVTVPVQHESYLHAEVKRIYNKPIEDKAGQPVEPLQSSESLRARLLPPSSPSGLTEKEERELAVRWRLKCLEIGMERYLRQHPRIDRFLVYEYYAEKRCLILDAGNEDLDSLVPKPRATPYVPCKLFGHKRKATEQPGDHNRESAALDEARKRQRSPGRVSNPTFHSQTANLFSSIATSAHSSPQKNFANVPFSSAPSGNKVSSEEAGVAPVRQHKAAASPSVATEVTAPIFQSLTKNVSAPPVPAETNALPKFANDKPVITEKSTNTGSSISPNKNIFSQGSGFQMPKFGASTANDFMSQFGKVVEKSADAEKKKRKAENFDSDEDDEAEWERKDAEEQAAKRKKIEEEVAKAQNTAPRFGNDPSEPAKKMDNNIFGIANPSSTQNQKDESLDKRTATRTPNIFGSPAMEKDSATGNPFNSQTPALTTTSKNIFGSLHQPTTLNQSPPKVATNDYTFDANKTPIKFGSTPSAETTPAPAPESAATKQTSSKITSLFGAPSTSAPSIGSSTGGMNIFANLQQQTASSNVGFGFGPAQASSVTKSSDTPSTSSQPSSNGPVKSPEKPIAQPAETSEDPEDLVESHEQVDLAGQRSGEEGEDVLFEVKAKAFAIRKDEGKSQWRPQGVGPLRVLQDRQTRQVRIVLRMEPSGKIIINSLLPEEAEYKILAGNAVSAPIIENGKIVPYQLKVGKPEDQKRLHQILQDHRPKK